MTAIIIITMIITIYKHPFYSPKDGSPLKSNPPKSSSCALNIMNDESLSSRKLSCVFILLIVKLACHFLKIILYPFVSPQSINQPRK